MEFTKWPSSESFLAQNTSHSTEMGDYKYTWITKKKSYKLQWLKHIHTIPYHTDIILIVRQYIMCRFYSKTWIYMLQNTLKYFQKMSNLNETSEQKNLDRFNFGFTWRGITGYNDLSFRSSSIEIAIPVNKIDSFRMQPLRAWCELTVCLII